MDKPAALRATWSDFKIIKGRKIVQLIFEVPIEGADEALHVLGGLPRADMETWVGIARLETREAPLPEAKPKRAFNELPPTQQAAIRCGEKAFQRYLEEVHLIGGCGPEEAAAFIRSHCNVMSRSELNAKAEAAEMWRRLEEDYLLWLNAP